MGSICPLCAADLEPIISESAHWRLVLNQNQNLLGKCFLVLRSHVENVSEVALDEWIDLRDQLDLATQALYGQFAPDHFNYSFLQNQDRHVHMHIIPRYEKDREFAAVYFSDPDYPNHYSVTMPKKQLPNMVFEQLADSMRIQIKEAQAT